MIAPTSDSDADLVARCRRRIDAVLPGRPTSIAVVRNALETYRSRRIRVVTGDPAGLTLPSGIWLQLRDKDVVWADQRTSKMHQIVIIGHEFGHILCGHQPTPIEDCPAARPFRTLTDEHLGFPASTLTAVMGRCGLAPGAAVDGSTEQREAAAEREAEVVGRLLAEQLLGAARGGFAEALAEL